MTETAIALENIMFEYGASGGSESAAVLNGEGGRASAIDGVSFTVQKGECLLLTGISGCGKTSLLRLINGLIPHYYEGSLLGEITVSGESILHRPVYDISKKVSTVFQNPKSQFFNLDTTSEILFFLENMGTRFEKMHERLNFVSQFLHIEHLLDRTIFNLSGGEKQMIAIASALASDTDIILFDEPTANLDIFYIEKIKEALRLLKESGKTLIISEHRLYFLKELIDRVLIIKDGKIAYTLSGEAFSALTEEKRKELLLRPIEMNRCVFSRSAANLGSRHERSADGSACDCRAGQLVIEQLIYRFPKDTKDFLSVQNVKMDFGKVIALTGKNGQGKSTLAHCLTGLLKARKECVSVNGKTINAKQRLAISYMVMQDVGYQLFTESVEEEITLGKNKNRLRKYVSPSSELKGENSKVTGFGSELSTESVLEKMHLTDLKDRHPLSLSGGQKQRVAIGSSVSSGANIIIMDEPTSGMDYFHMKETAALINTLRSPERLILIISHDFEFLSLTADEIIVMEKGAVLSHAPFTEAEAERVFEYLKTLTITTNNSI
ncbi:ABC transporter ATP-binding protein [Treponema pedis]|uniref:ABC transporter ATP-binding protein n=1 Tax=Treponema pedis TaxID=409322 RepID=UPI000408FE83|nr:ABC transporter ATP-binding protein [Treponema pedis]